MKKMKYYLHCSHIKVDVTKKYSDTPSKTVLSPMNVIRKRLRQVIMNNFSDALLIASLRIEFAKFRRQLCRNDMDSGVRK